MIYEGSYIFNRYYLSELYPKTYITPRHLTTYDYKVLPRWVFRNRNNSISAYRNRRNGPMWVPDVYSKIRKFLCQNDRINLWIAHKRYLPDRRPTVLIHNKLNPEYALWFLRQIPRYVNLSVVICVLLKINEEVNINKEGKIKQITGSSSIKTINLLSIT